ncbi:ABC transporter ATP-binding protein [Desulfoferula mesophila]|uniref:ABC transporter ATP-binding protein n=1 Tax=Desulfoferula mesophila TaxID=3058419 RepID=A0AAU9EDV9_9BACT|nr:ABC transporter ATP-binding protein [Desulfoferula mesophilus]
MLILEVDRINTYYGKSHILQDVSLKVEQGQIVALLGRNGAGKTTTLRSIMGLTPPRSGAVRFKGQDIQRCKPFEVARKGLGFVPEDRGIFPDISVLDNLTVAAKQSADGQRRWSLEKIYHYFPVLQRLRDNKGQNLSGGEQQMLTIARTLMTNPDLLLLDEPCEGLAPQIVNQVLFGLIKSLKEQEGVTILLAEQNARFCLGLADWGYLLDKGAVQFDASSEEITSNEEIQRKYLSL